MIQSTRLPIIQRTQGYYIRWYYNGWHYWQFYPGLLSYLTEGEKYRTRGSRRITASSGQLTETQSNAVRTILNTREVYLYSDSGWAAVRIDTGSAVIKNNETKGCEVIISLSIGSRMLSVTGFSPVVPVPEIPVIPDVMACKVDIGIQSWACKNYESNYPGSRVYDDVEANRTIYGGLYTYAQIMAPGFCPAGWHVPSLAEWDELITFAGGAAITGGKLKAAGTTYWNSPNSGAADTYGFATRGAGYYLPGTGYGGQKTVSNFWVTDEASSTRAYVVQMGNETEEISVVDLPKEYYLSVRLISNTLRQRFNDYFLPSKDELNAIYTELYLHGVGGIALAGYWSSTEMSATTAWYYHFSGSGGSLAKSEGSYLIPCRSFVAGVNDYQLRQLGPAGGYIFYKNGTNYMEIHPDIENTYQALNWSNINNVASGATGTAIGTGKTNTDAIIAQTGHVNSAAKICHDLMFYK